MTTWEPFAQQSSSNAPSIAAQRAPERTQRFIVADGRQLERPIGIAIVHAAGTTAPDFVVFAEPGDMVLIGARTLEGLNVRVDAQRKQLVPAGPILAGTVG